MSNDAEIIRLYKSGKSCAKVARIVGLRSHVSVLNTLKRCGISRRNRHDCMLGTCNARKHSLNESFFQIIDTEEKAYHLGLLYADGWINTKSGTVGISLIDKEVVERFKAAIQSSVPINVLSSENPNHGVAYSFVFASARMISDLKRHGCVENKSLILDFPTTVPSHLIHHFIRGYWDGDGYVRIDGRKNLRFGMCGSPLFIEKVKDVFASMGLSGPKILKHGIIRRLDFSGTIHAFRFRCLAFRDATMWMERKKTKLFSKLPTYTVPSEMQSCLLHAMKNPEYPCKIK